MATSTPQDSATEFSRRPRVLGRSAVLVGLAVIAVTSFFTPSAELKEWARIAGLALILVGGLTYAFGRLVQSANKASRTGGSGPVA